MSFEKDIVLKDKEACFYFRYLDWDSNFFNKPSYLLEVDRSNLIATASIKKKIKEQLENCFVTAKIPTYINFDILFFLQQCGFYYINTEITLKYFPKNELFSEKIDDSIIIEHLKENVNLPYKKLGETFNKTRFHEDVHIDNVFASSLWIKYIKNFIPSDKHHMFIAKYNNEIVGAILVNINGDIANLFFVAVLKEFQGLKIGQKLVQKICSSFKKYKLTVGTQNTNIVALNFYIKNGFSMIENTSTILHRWK